MNARETRITQVVKSRAFALLLILASVVAASVAAGMVPSGASLMAPGMGLFGDPTLSPGWLMPVCMVLNVAVIVVMSLLNGQYNLLRTTSWLFLAMWSVSQAGSPFMMTQAVTGIAATVGMLVCVWIGFSIYQQPGQTKRVFLLFFIGTCMGCRHYAYWAFLPVFLAGLAQMRAVSLRSLLAAGVGIAVPAWLLWSFDIVDFSALKIPVWHPTSVALLRDNVVMSVTLAFTLVTGVVLNAANMVKVYGYNAVTRAHNGLLLLVWLVSALLCLLDFGSLWAVLPLLNCTTAFQAGLFFRIYTRRRAYLPMIIIIAVYAALYVCNILSM